MKHQVLSLVDRLTRQRKAWGLSREYIAGKTEISVHSIMTIELGRRQPTVKMLIAIADALGYELVLKPKS